MQQKTYICCMCGLFHHAKIHCYKRLRLGPLGGQLLMNYDEIWETLTTRYQYDEIWLNVKCKVPS